MNKIKLLLQKHCIVLGFMMFLLCTTATTCNDDNRPSFTEAFPDTEDVEISLVSLKYDLTQFLQKCQQSGYDVSHDMLELSACHGIVPSSSWAWLDFHGLLFGVEDYPESKRANASFIFYSPDYSGEKKIIYDKYDEKLCLHNIISSAPKVNREHFIDFDAQTITTQQNSVCIKWATNLVRTGYDLLIIEKKGDVESSCFFSTGVTSKSGSGGIIVAARPKNNNNLEVVENTVKDGLSDRSYTTISISSLPIISPLLTQNICIAGSVSERHRWEAPYLIELEEL